MKKTVYIKLKQKACELGAVYVVDQLKNAASFSVRERFFRVGDTISPELADRLCDNLNYEVTINN